MCQTSSGQSTTNICTHRTPDRHITVTVRINEEKEIEKRKFNVIVNNLTESDKTRPDERKKVDLDKLNDICTVLSTEPTNIANAV